MWRSDMAFCHGWNVTTSPARSQPPSRPNFEMSLLTDTRSRPRNAQSSYLIGTQQHLTCCFLPSHPIERKVRQFMYSVLHVSPCQVCRRLANNAKLGRFSAFSSLAAPFARRARQFAVSAFGINHNPQFIPSLVEGFLDSLRRKILAPRTLETDVSVRFRFRSRAQRGTLAK